MNKTWFEIAEDAHEIIRRSNLSEQELLNEGLMDSLMKFIRNYSEMKSMLADLQKVLLKGAKNDKKNDIHGMGDGTYIKAYNASMKVDNQLRKMNKEAKSFIDLMKAVLQKG